MLPYWILFLVPAILAGAVGPRKIKRRDRTLPLRLDGATLVIFLLIVVMIGFRYQVGGDWYNYIRHLRYAEFHEMNFASAFLEGDPGYWVLVVFGVQSGLDILAVNVIAAIIFTIGLVVFCASLPRPFLAFACAIPYLVIVVAMGYTRQSMAIGWVMMGLASLRRGGIYSFVFLALVGALFHKTAVVVIPLVAVLRARNWTIKLLFAASAGVLGYMTLLSDSLDEFMLHYIEAGYQSSGALLRLTMNAVPAILFVLLRKRMDMSLHERQLYLILSLLSLAALAGYFVTSASTALDRMALYLIPLQLFVFSRLPDAMARSRANSQPVVLAILCYHGLIMYVWLNFAANAYAWEPYHSYIW